jgi:DNA-binding transcriptional ArsR family regulator
MDDEANRMTAFRGDGMRRGGKREQALSNPIRRGIVELFTADEARPLSAAAVTDDLGRSVKVSASQVGYHLARLRDADLIPTEKAEGRYDR